MKKPKKNQKKLRTRKAKKESKAGVTLYKDNLQNNIDVNETDAWGNSIILSACSAGEYHVVKHLIMLHLM